MARPQHSARNSSHLANVRCSSYSNNNRCTINTVTVRVLVIAVVVANLAWIIKKYIYFFKFYY